MAATRYGGEVMDMDVGAIAPGKLADILLVTGDPTADITILQDKRRIPMVMKGGAFHRFDEAGLRAYVPEANQRAA